MNINFDDFPTGTHVVHPFPSCEARVEELSIERREQTTWLRTHRQCKRTGHYRLEGKRYCLQHFRIFKVPDPLSR